MSEKDETKSETKSETKNDAKEGGVKTFLRENKVWLSAMVALLVGAGAGYGAKTYLQHREENPVA